MNMVLQSLGCMKKKLNSCENFLVHFLGCDPRSFNPTHNDPAWECKRRRRDEAASSIPRLGLWRIQETKASQRQGEVKAWKKEEGGGESGRSRREDEAKQGGKEKVGKRRYREREWRESCRLDPTPLPMVCTDTEPHQVLFSHRTALKHPSHPITADARLPKRTGRAWWNWGQSEFEGTWWGPLGYGVSCRARTFVSPSKWHLTFKAMKKRSHQMIFSTFSIAVEKMWSCVYSVP